MVLLVTGNFARTVIRVHRCPGGTYIRHTDAEPSGHRFDAVSDVSFPPEGDLPCTASADLSFERKGFKDDDLAVVFGSEIDNLPRRVDSDELVIVVDEPPQAVVFIVSVFLRGGDDAAVRVQTVFFYRMVDKLPSCDSTVPMHDRTYRVCIDAKVYTEDCRDLTVAYVLRNAF